MTWQGRIITGLVPPDGHPPTPNAPVTRITLPIAGVMVTIRPDPLGPVNKILTLSRGPGLNIRSKLYPVNEGDTVVLGNGGGFMLGPTWREMNGIIDPNPVDYGPPYFYVEVNGKRIMTVPEHETWGPPVKLKKKTLGQRFREAETRFYDRIAKYFGYVPDDGRDRDDDDY